MEAARDDPCNPVPCPAEVPDHAPRSAQLCRLEMVLGFYWGSIVIMEKKMETTGIIGVI